MKMIIKQAVVLAALALAQGVRASLPVNDDFQGYPVGRDFTSATNNWNSDANVWVTNGVNRYSDSPATNSVAFTGSSGLTNQVNSNVLSVVWTDFHIKPFKGDIPSSLPTNLASHVHYYDTNGYVVVAVSNGWVTCSNDVWGMAVPPITDNWVHISIYQNYATSNSAMMVNDQLVLQDLPFVGTAGSYGKFITRNAQNSAWLDDVWIQTSYNPTLTANRNGDAGGLADARELQLYGYAARTQYVGGGIGYPNYPTLQAALNAYRQHDVLYVNGGTYNESLTVTQDVVIAGTVFTNSGSMTVSAGVTLTLNQSAMLSSLALAGTLAQVSGTLTCGSVTVGASGRVTVAQGATFSDLTALSITAGGQLEFLGVTSHFISIPGSVDMTGQFTVTNNLSDSVSMGIPFVDDFENYAVGSTINALGFRGWNATAGALVTNGSWLAGYATGRTVNQAVCLPDGTIMSNRMVSSVGQNIWTDYYLSPYPGVEPTTAPTGSASFVSFVNTNGYLVVATTGGWVTCSRNYTNGPVPPMAASTFARLTVHQDYTKRIFSLFLNGILLLDAQPFAAGGSVYSSFQVHNNSGTAFLDDVRITTTLPGWMTLDLNGNGIPDAYEIQLYGKLGNFAGAIYLFR